ncbi:MAG: GNAT family N-acetyltransferase [Ferruginibacter sp.]
MYLFSNHNISIATETDIAYLANLLNISYRGEASKQGWTTEAALISGDTRADENMVQNVMQRPGSIFLKFTNDENKIIACVNLEQQGQKIYLGMFSVLPNLQGAGIGKLMLKASEEYALQKKCSSIYMSVISLRTELINWYERYGYADTGKRIPFEEDGITGKHLQKLEFMVLEKQLF